MNRSRQKDEFKEAASASQRLASIDVLRGFNMFFITGGSALIAGTCAALKCPDAWISVQMRHVNWIGFAHHDTIFPLFLFLSGVSWPFSLASQRSRGRSVLSIQLKILARVAALFLIGLSFGGILKFNPDFRLMSVLGFIGISWGVASTLSMYIRKAWVLLAIAAAFLSGYYLLLHFCAAPGVPVGADHYAVTSNIVAHWDRSLWPKHLCIRGKYDPESLFSIPGGVALALFGVLAGRLLGRKDGPSPADKSLVLVAWAGVAAVAACTFEHGFGNPVIKKLWTPSFVLYAAAYSLAMLAVFHFVVDVLGWRRWTVVFDPVGKNSLLAYLLSMVGVSAAIHGFLFSGLCKWAGEWGRALSGLTLYLVVWSILCFFRSRRIFLKV
jgi:predicted acyltransferase